MTQVQLDPAIAFAKLAVMHAIGRGDLLQGMTFGETKGWTPQVEVMRSAATMSSSTAAALIPTIASDFSAAVAPLTIVGRLAGTRRSLFNVRMISEDGQVASGWVGEGSPIPVSSDAFLEDPPLAPTKDCAILIVSAELGKRATPGSLAVLAAAMKRATTRQLDHDFLDPDNAGQPDVRPASIAYGAPSLVSSGSSVSAIDSDATAMVSTLIDGGSTLENAAWIMDGKTAVRLSLKRGTSAGAPAYPGVTAKGGVWCGLPVYVTATATGDSSSPAEGRIFLVDASAISIADDGGAELSTSNEAAVQLSSTPLEGARPLLSLWQSNLVGLRIVRTINWMARRPNAVVVLRNVSY